LSNKWVIEEIRKEVNKFQDSNEKEDTIYQNLWDTGKAVLRGNFIAMIAHIRKLETSQINNLLMHLKHLEKQEKTKPKSNPWKRL
jgi:hypothetical protein